MYVYGLQLIKVRLVQSHRAIGVSVTAACDTANAPRDQVAVNFCVCAICGIAPQKIEPQIVDFAGGRPLQDDLTELALRGER